MEETSFTEPPGLSTPKQASLPCADLGQSSSKPIDLINDSSSSIASTTGAMDALLSMSKIDSLVQYRNLLRVLLPAHRDSPLVYSVGAVSIRVPVNTEKGLLDIMKSLYEFHTQREETVTVSGDYIRLMKNLQANVEFEFCLRLKDEVTSHAHYNYSALGPLVAAFQITYCNYMHIPGESEMGRMPNFESLRTWNAFKLFTMNIMKGKKMFFETWGSADYLDRQTSDSLNLLLDKVKELSEAVTEKRLTECKAQGRDCFQQCLLLSFNISPTCLRAAAYLAGKPSIVSLLLWFFNATCKTPSQAMKNNYLCYSTFLPPIKERPQVLEQDASILGNTWPIACDSTWSSVNLAGLGYSSLLDVFSGHVSKVRPATALLVTHIFPDSQSSSPSGSYSFKVFGNMDAKEVYLSIYKALQLLSIDLATKIISNKDLLSAIVCKYASKFDDLDALHTGMQPHLSTELLAAIGDIDANQFNAAKYIASYKRCSNLLRVDLTNFVQDARTTLAQKSEFIQDDLGPCTCRIANDKNLCGGRCINKHSGYECHGNIMDPIGKRRDCNCSMGDASDCGNRRAGRVTMELLDTQVHTKSLISKGFILVAKKNLAVGEFQCVYSGEACNINMYQERMKAREKLSVYLIQVGRETYVDAANAGNCTRNISHSCNPNCNVDVRIIESVATPVVYNIRDIKQGDELTFSYFRTPKKGMTKGFICNCKSANCVDKDVLQDATSSQDSQILLSSMECLSPLGSSQSSVSCPVEGGISLEQRMDVSMMMEADIVDRPDYVLRASLSQDSSNSQTSSSTELSGEEIFWLSGSNESGSAFSSTDVSPLSMGATGRLLRSSSAAVKQQSVRKSQTQYDHGFNNESDEDFLFGDDVHSPFKRHVGIKRRISIDETAYGEEVIPKFRLKRVQTEGAASIFYNEVFDEWMDGVTGRPATFYYKKNIVDADLFEDEEEDFLDPKGASKNDKLSSKKAKSK